MVADLTGGEGITAWNNFVLRSDPQAAKGTFRDAAIANQFMALANNGGLNSFLTASYDLDADEVHAALTSLGATEAAAALRYILDSLGEALPQATHDERSDALDRLWRDEIDANDTLSESADAELTTVLTRHVDANRDHYLRLPE